MEMREIRAEVRKRLRERVDWDVGGEELDGIGALEGESSGEEADVVGMNTERHCEQCVEPRCRITLWTVDV